MTGLANPAFGSDMTAEARIATSVQREHSSNNMSITINHYCAAALLSIALLIVYILLLLLFTSVSLPV